MVILEGAICGSGMKKQTEEKRKEDKKMKRNKSFGKILLVGDISRLTSLLLELCKAAWSGYWATDQKKKHKRRKITKDTTW